VDFSHRHAFLDAYEHFHRDGFLQVAASACEHIQRDLGASQEGESLCINYFPTSHHQVHNANTLGASFLARTYSHTRREADRYWREGSCNTAKHQRPDSSWYTVKQAICGGSTLFTRHMSLTPSSTIARPLAILA